MSNDAHLGEIRLFAGGFVPRGWAMCDGTALQVSAYQALFAVIGTTYGDNGTGTFRLPDLRGRIPVGMGQGTGLSPYGRGETGGSEAVTLTSANLPMHSHAVNVSSAAATTNTPGKSVALATVDSTLHVYVDTTQGTVTGTTDFSPNAVGAIGGNQPHDNLMPCLGLLYLINLDGTFPSHQ